MSSSLFILVCLLVGYGQSFVADVSLEQLQVDLVNMQHQMTALQQTVTDLHKQLNDTGRLAAQAAAVPHHAPVAFTAHLSKTIAALSPHQQIAFNTVVTNVGGAYSPSSGHFTAPVFGVYVFTLTMTNVPGFAISLSIMKNGQDVAHTLAHSTHTSSNDQWETSTISAVVSLVAGENVWIQNEGQFSSVEKLDGYNYSSFTGFLLNEL